MQGWPLHRVVRGFLAWLLLSNSIRWESVWCESHMTLFIYHVNVTHLRVHIVHHNMSHIAILRCEYGNMCYNVFFYMNTGPSDVWCTGDYCVIANIFWIFQIFCIQNSKNLHFYLKTDEFRFKLLEKNQKC